MFKGIITTILALSVTAFEASGAFSIVTVTDTQARNTGSSDTGSNANDMADFQEVVTEVLADNRDYPQFRDPASHYERYVGMGFALNSACNSSTQLGNSAGNSLQNNDSVNRNCGEPNPAD